MNRLKTIRCRMSKLVGNQAASALVETALTFPVLIAMLLGAVELGLIAHGSIEVTNAARAAAQYAAMNGGHYSDPSGLQLAAQNDAGELKIESATATNSCACSDGSGACAQDPTTKVYSCTTGKAVVTVSVTTSAIYPLPIKIPGLDFGDSVTLQGSAQEQVLP